MSFIVGLGFLALGILIIVKSEWMLRNFGRIGWFDQHLGFDGGSRLGYKLIGMAIVFIGVLIVTGLFNGFAATITSPLTKLMR